LVSAIAAILLIRRILEPTSLVVALVPSLLRSSGTENVFDYLSRLDTLDCFFFGSFVSVRDGGSENIFDYASWEALYEELDGLWVREVISRDLGEMFEIICVLIDFGPLQPEGLQFCPGTLLVLRVLILHRKLCEELLPNSRNIIDWLESVNPFAHSPCPFSDKRSLDKREGEGDSLDV